jgi:aspartokinase
MDNDFSDQSFVLSFSQNKESAKLKIKSKSKTNIKTNLKSKSNAELNEQNKLKTNSTLNSLSHIHTNISNKINTSNKILSSLSDKNENNRSQSV